jgi:hypothetical protein
MTKRSMAVGRKRKRKLLLQPRACVLFHMYNANAIKLALGTPVPLVPIHQRGPKIHFIYMKGRR